MSAAKEGKRYEKKKPWKNNAKHRNRQAQKIGFASESIWCVPTEEKMTTKL